MTIDFSVLLDNWSDILRGMYLTLKIWLASTLVGGLLGLALATLQVHCGRLLSFLVAMYIYVFRGVPLLILLFLIYYGGPSMGLVLDPVPAGILGLGLHSSAYFAENFRAGYQSVDSGQIEAAQLAGLSGFQTLLHVQLPQMLVVVVPALANTVVNVTKETAILSVIAVPELTAVLSGIGSATYAFVETLFVLAAFYWLLLEGVSMLARRAEGFAGRHLAR